MTCFTRKLTLIFGVFLLAVFFLSTGTGLAGPGGKSGSGRIDLNNIDCDNIDKLDKRMQIIAKRKCQQNKPSFVISNKATVNSEPTPADVYSGADKSELGKMIEKAWKQKYPGDTVLGLRFHMKNWKRDANLKANSTSVYATDTSVLSVSVMVKDGDRHVLIFPAYINKDNLDGSINIGVDTKKSQYIVKKMLLKNWKP